MDVSGEVLLFGVLGLRSEGGGTYTIGLGRDMRPMIMICGGRRLVSWRKRDVGGAG